jgi:membrane peptidoglycan carboxypeptidase
LKPYVVDRVMTKDGHVVSQRGRTLRRRALSVEVAKQLAEFMGGVVTRGTGIPAKPSGYSAAGKTGTAWKVDPKTGAYAPGKYVVTFAGFSPAEKPKLVAVVVVDEPGTPGYGGTIAGPAFARIADRVLPHLGLPRGGAPMEFQGTTGVAGGRAVVPDLRGLSSAEAVAAAQKAGLSPELVQDGPLLSEQSILPGTLVEKGTRLQLRGGEAVVPGRMPDLRGKALRAAMAALGAIHPKIRVEGNGVVAGQSPLPGTLVGPDTEAVLRLEPPVPVAAK